MIGAIVYARCDSKRFPNKAFNKLGGKYLVEWCIDALLQLKEKLDIKIILASTNRVIDEPLKILADRKKIAFVGGDLNDIANRTIKCIKELDLTSFIRINGDSPFINIPLIEEGIDIFIKGDYDLVSNIHNRSYPYGISFEMLNANTFINYYSIFDKDQKEHITQYFYSNINQFKLSELPLLSHNLSDINLAIDTPEDMIKMNLLLKLIGNIDINNYSIKELTKTNE